MDDGDDSIGKGKLPRLSEAWQHSFDEHPRGRTTDDVLAQHALEIGCDMIVMGVYGHSRLREASLVV